MELNLDDRAKMREASDAYKGTDLATQNNDYFQEKPYWVEHESADKWAKAMAIVGHLLSIAIGSICGYHLGKALFSGFDLLVWGSVTLGAVLGLAFIVVITGVWEIIKNKFLHRFFKEWYQFKRKYTTSRQWAKLAVLFGASLVLSGYGGFEVVTRWFGDAVTSETTLVEVDKKVAHIERAIAAKRATIDSMNIGQKIYTDKGQARRVKVDEQIGGIEAVIYTLDSTLIEQRAYWEQHNITANGNTEQDNDKIKEDHAGNSIWYALLFSLFAIAADTLTLYCIRYNERYRYQSHREMIGVDYFVNQAQRRNHKMAVVYRADKTMDETIAKNETSPDETIELPQDTSPKNETSPVAGNKTTKDTSPKKKHGNCYWEDGKAFMWYKRQTNGSITSKDARQLKGLRNKALTRSKKAVTEEARSNNKTMARYYDELYTKLVDFQTQNQAI